MGNEGPVPPWLGEIPAHWEVERIHWLLRERDERCERDLPLMDVSIASGVSAREFTGEKIEPTAADLDTYKVARKSDLAFNRMCRWQGADGVAPIDGLVSPDDVVAEVAGRVIPDSAGLLIRSDVFSVECGRGSGRRCGAFQQFGRRPGIDAAHSAVLENRFVPTVSTGHREVWHAGDRAGSWRSPCALTA